MFVGNMELLNPCTLNGAQNMGGWKRLKFLEEENNRLKRMFANLSLEARALKDLIEKKL